MMAQVLSAPFFDTSAHWLLQQLGQP